MSKIDKQRAQALGTSEMEKRLAALRQTSFADLMNLPNYKTDNLKVGKYEVRITTYRDILEDDSLQIVVQWQFYIWPGFGRIGAGGFTISRDDEIRDLEEEDLDEFK